MSPRSEISAPAQPEAMPRLFAGLFGSFLGLALLKFGNPPIFEKWTIAPSDPYEFFLAAPWPISWAYGLLLGLVVIAAFCRLRRGATPLWLLGLPLAWLLWQLFATARSIDPELSIPTLKHFAANAVCFYLGVFALSRSRSLWPFWLPILAAFLLILFSGWSQHFGGLKATRDYFFLYLYPKMKEVMPGYLKKVASDRIFATLFYPNALAGALLLLMPALLVVVWRMRNWFTGGARAFIAAALLAGSLACLFWSGSKGGWLLMLMLGVCFGLRLPFGRQFKLGLLGVLVAMSLGGFFWKYSAFFERGATSVGARVDYWRAALHTAMGKPGLGSGPGTFGVTYAAVKRPDSEPARLAHNDYLEQASDSGFPGFLLYSAFIVGALAWTFRRHFAHAPLGADLEHWQTYAVWLGVFGWALQGLAEFGLYLPALSWPAFALLGWLVGKSDREATHGIAPVAA